LSAPSPARPDRRRAIVPGLIGVIVGLLIAGVLVPLLGDDDTTTATAGGTVTTVLGGSAEDGVAPGDQPAGGGGPGASTTVTTTATGTVGATGGPTAAGDTSPIKVGFSLFDVGGASKLGFPIGADPEWERRAYQAFVDAINAEGGINGRKLVPSYSTYDLTNADTQQASCLALTQDAHVFAVIGGYNYSAANQCVVESNKTLLVNSNSFTIDELYASGRHLSIFAKGSRMMSLFAGRLGAAGQLKGKKVGVLDDLGADPTKSTLAALRNAVKANGGTVVREAVLSGDLASGSSQIPVEVSQMRTAGVDVVLFLASPLYGTQFAQQADSQRWTPTYAATDWGANYADVAVQNMPPSFAGAYSITSVRTGEHRMGTPPPSKAPGCGATFEKYSKTKLPKWGEDNYGLIMQTCDVMRIFAGAARGAGPNLTASTFIAAAQRLGASDQAAWGAGSFGPGKLDFNDQTRINRWSADCKCWKPSTPFS